MKQKLILLLVLIASLAACTKDDDDDYISEINPASTYTEKNGVEENTSNQGTGMYVGNWVIGRNTISSGDTIIVKDDKIQLKLPEKKLLETAAYFYEETYGYIFRKNPIHKLYEPKTYNRNFGYMMKGISATKTYYDLYLDNVSLYFSTDGVVFPVVVGMMEVKINGSSENIEKWRIGFLTDKPGSAIYDKEKQLWALSIQLKSLYIYANEEVRVLYIQSHDDGSYPELVFVSNKKL